MKREIKIGVMSEADDAFFSEIVSCEGIGVSDGDIIDEVPIARFGDFDNREDGK